MNIHYITARLQQARTMAAQSADPCSRVAHVAMVKSYQRLLVMLQPHSPSQSSAPMPVTQLAFVIAGPPHSILAANGAS
ncbi:MAG TPA: hypothetical protein VF509_16110 [Sphingobium sp.]